MVSIVPASALQRWILDPHSWVDTFLVELDAGQSETKHVLHLFRGGAMIAEIRLSLDGKPQAGHYAFVDFAASTGKTPNIVAASSLGGNRILVTDAEGRLRILECVPAASQ